MGRRSVSVTTQLHGEVVFQRGDSSLLQKILAVFTSTLPPGFAKDSAQYSWLCSWSSGLKTREAHPEARTSAGLSLALSQNWHHRVAKVGEGVGKLEPLCTEGGNVNRTATMENSMAAPRKLKIESAYNSAIPLLGI